jgi:hypothetical protein
VVIGSSVLSSVISFRDVWANAQAQGSDDLDHERDITLAIHAAIPDLITDSIRSNPHFHAGGGGCASAAEPRLQVNAGSMNSVSRHTGWQRLHGLSETVRVELTGEARLAEKDTNTITAVRCRYKSKGPFDDR